MAGSTGPRLVDDLSSLKIQLDGKNPKLKGEGRSLKRAFGNSTIDDSSINVPFLDSVDGVATQRFTLITWLEINGYNTGYAWHPINKWNSGWTDSASIVLYAFQDYRPGGGGSVEDGLGNDDHNRYGFYWHRYNAGGWAGFNVHEDDDILGGLENRNNFPRKNFFAFSYDVALNDSKPRIYCNGQFLGNGSASPNGIGNPEFEQHDLTVYTSFSGVGNEDSGATYLQIHDRMLTDEEILNIYNNTKKLHGYG